MDSIKATGAADYTVNIPQNKQENETPAYDNYQTMPMVYEPETEQKKSASFGMAGLTAAGVVCGLAGLAIGKKWGGKGLNDAKAAAEDAVKKYEAIAKEKETLEKAKNEAEKALGEYRTADPMTRFIRRFYPNYKLSKEEIAAKNAAREAKAEADKAAKEAEKAEKKNADKAEKKDDKAEKSE